MDSSFFEELTAELAALNIAVTAALSAAADLAPDRKAYLEKVFRDGEVQISRMNFYALPEDRRTATIEQAQSRFAQIIAPLNRPHPT